MEAIFIDLEDKMVAAITEEHRKKIRYTCSPCKPEKGEIPCILACNQNAISCIWKPKIGYVPTLVNLFKLLLFLQLLY